MLDIIRKHKSLECGNKKMIFTSGELYLYSACFVFRSHSTKVPLSNPISNYNKPEKMSLFILLSYKFCFDAEILYRIIAFCYKKKTFRSKSRKNICICVENGTQKCCF